MPTDTKTTNYRIRRTHLAWRIPAAQRIVDAAPSAAPMAIGTAYAESPLAASPARALLAAVAASTTLIVTFGALALPAAAFA